MSKLFLILSILVLSAASSMASDSSLFDLVCPDDVETDCLSAHETLDAYGRAYVEIYNETHYVQPVEVVSDINECGAGCIVRIYQESFLGSTLSCTQKIVVSGEVTDFEDHISWPRDIDVVGCYPDIDPSSFSISHRHPLFYEGPCMDIEMSYEDCEDFDYGEQCRKIKRLWTLIDHCQYDENDPNPQGVYQNAQYIKVYITDEPSLNIPHDVTLTSFNCTTAFIDLSSVMVSDNTCGDPYVVTHDSPYADQQGIDASGDYPLGTTKITYELPLGCWNRSLEYSFSITVEKSQECIDQEYEQSLKQTNLAGDVYMYHDYSDIAGASISILSDQMDTTYQTLYDTMMVEVVVDSTLEVGRGRGWTYITEMQIVITEYEEISLEPLSYEALTDNDGQYIFEWLDDGNYSMDVVLPEILSVDYTFADMGYLYDYLEGRITDVSPYFLLAADVDNSGHVDNDDYELYRNLFSGAELPIKDRFILLPESHTFVDPSEPWDDITYTSMVTQDDMRYADNDMVRMNYICIPRGKFSDNAFAGNRSATGLNTAFIAYPNPFSDQLNIQFYTDDAMNAEVELFDITGKSHARTTLTAVSGYNDYRFLSDKMDAGIYIVELRLRNNKRRQKVIKY